MNTVNLKNLKDEELVRLYIETQKNRYFEEIYDRYSDKIFRKCYSFVKDTARAQDFTHDIFIKLSVKIGTFKETARFSTWLYSITYNYCMDQLRLIKKRGEYELNENFDLEAEDDGEDYELLQMKTVGLKKSMELLTAEEKAILIMKYQDDFSIKDIADTFGLTESAVKMRLMRTREKVKKVYLENFAFVALIVLKVILFLKK
ncbi:MAG: sigma-70 family RNA polymerase sigma factor [Spirosomaceae bacterium]|nr:sigma-70 family RNA polymerase sigma factor [Spirosomataceae bacterium]